MMLFKQVKHNRMSDSKLNIKTCQIYEKKNIPAIKKTIANAPRYERPALPINVGTSKRQTHRKWIEREKPADIPNTSMAPNSCLVSSIKSIGRITSLYSPRCINNIPYTKIHVLSLYKHSGCISKLVKGQ